MLDEPQDKSAEVIPVGCSHLLGFVFSLLNLVMMCDIVWE